MPLLCQPRLHNHAENRKGWHALLRHGTPDTPTHKNRGWRAYARHPLHAPD
ncbi:hypothetical protein GOB83_03140 [Acetobacter fabarum]|nr:hypothetical protein [Acetobacter fabarum]